MEQVAQAILVNPNSGIQAAAIAGALKDITVRAAKILALVVLTYGLVAAEIRLANIEQHTASLHR